MYVHTIINYYPAVRANVEIGEETGSGAINCPGTIDVTSDGTYCNGELVRGPSGSATDIVSTTESSAQSGFVAVAGMGAVIILAALM